MKIAPFLNSLIHYIMKRKIRQAVLRRLFQLFSFFLNFFTFSWFFLRSMDISQKNDGGKRTSSPPFFIYSITGDKIAYKLVPAGSPKGAWCSIAPLQRRSLQKFPFGKIRNCLTRKNLPHIRWGRTLPLFGFYLSYNTEKAVCQWLFCENIPSLRFRMAGARFPH